MQTQPIILLDDLDSQFRTATERRQPFHTSQVLQRDRRVLEFYPYPAEYLAVVCEHDRFTLESCQQLPAAHTVPVNGNRPQKLDEIATSLGGRARCDPSLLVLLITSDSDCVRTVKTALGRTPVIVFWPGPDCPTELEQLATRQEGISLRHLDQLLPIVRPPKLGTDIDLENLVRTILNLHLPLDLLALHAAIQRSLADKGELDPIVYYADFSLLEQLTGQPLRRIFDEHGIQYVHYPSIAGKNSIDMVISLHVNNQSHNPLVDTLVVGTGDKDFRIAFREARQNGKKVIVLGFKGWISPALIEAAHEVVTVDDYLPAASAPQAAPLYPNDLAELLLKIANQQRLNHWHFIGKEWLMAAFGATLAGRQLLQAALEADCLVPYPYKPASGLALNPENPLACACIYFSGWLPRQIEYLLAHKPYLSVGYLIPIMLQTPRLKELGLAYEHYQAGAWLDLAERAGLIIKTSQPDPKDPQRQINVCCLPSSAAVSQPSGHGQLPGSYVPAGCQANKNAKWYSESMKPAKGA